LPGRQFRMACGLARHPWPTASQADAYFPYWAAQTIQNSTCWHSDFRQSWAERPGWCRRHHYAPFARESRGTGFGAGGHSQAWPEKTAGIFHSMSRRRTRLKHAIEDSGWRWDGVLAVRTRPMLPLKGHPLYEAMEISRTHKLNEWGERGRRAAALPPSRANRGNTKQVTRDPAGWVGRRTEFDGAARCCANHGYGKRLRKLNLCAGRRMKRRSTRKALGARLWPKASDVRAVRSKLVGLRSNFNRCAGDRSGQNQAIGILLPPEGGYDYSFGRRHRAPAADREGRMSAFG